MDPIVIPGRVLKPMLGEQITNLRLITWRTKSGPQPAPFQIDERDPEGKFVFRGSSDNDKGALDANDELVFMARDAGHRIPREKWPASARRGMEIELTDPVDGGMAWVYLFAFDPAAAPDLSRTDYVQCKKNNRIIDARNYIAGFSKKAPMALNVLGIRKAGGGPDKDIMDRLKVRFHAESLLGIVIDRNEEDFTAKVLGVIDGPVRVIRSTSNRMVLIGKLPTPSSVSEQVFYYNSFEFPITIDVPVDLKNFFRNTWLRITSESAFPPQTYFYNQRNRDGVPVDGKMSPEEYKLDRGSYSWQVVAAQAPPNTGAWLNRLVFDQKKTPAVVGLYYMDDEERPDPPDEVPGQIGNLGYELKDLENLGAGQHPIKTYMYNMESYQPGQEKQVLNILDNPLKIMVRY